MFLKLLFYDRPFGRLFGGLKYYLAQSRTLVKETCDFSSSNILRWLQPPLKRKYRETMLDAEEACNRHLDSIWGYTYMILFSVPHPIINEMGWDMICVNQKIWPRFFSQDGGWHFKSLPSDLSGSQLVREPTTERLLKLMHSADRFRPRSHDLLGFRCAGATPSLGTLRWLSSEPWAARKCLCMQCVQYLKRRKAWLWLVLDPSTS